MGKLIVIEGTDSSGKATQTRLLHENLEKYLNKKVMKLDFPNYESNSSIFVKNYLAGDYGTVANEVDPYIASTFFTLDRYDTYKKHIEKFYIEDGILVSDRYTTANMVHQASKIKNLAERDKYLDWLYDYEFNMYKLPIPDLVIFLNLRPKYSIMFMENRKNKITGESKKDIHESSKDHLIGAYEAADYVAKKYNWINIECFNKETQLVKSIEQIQQEILKEVYKIL